MSSSERGSRGGWWGLLILLGMGAVGAAIVWAGRDPAPSRPARPLTWERIQAMVDRQDWARAEPLLERWVAEHPDDGQGRVLLAMLRQARGLEDQALELVRAVSPDDRAYLAARMMLGEAALRHRDAAEAEGIFRDLADRLPDQIEPRRKLIYLLSLEHRTDEAIGRLWEIYRATRDPRVLIDIGLEDLKFETDVRGVGPELEDFLRAAPEDPYLRRAWGLALAWRGRPSEALPHLEAAASAFDQDVEGRFTLAECRLALGQLAPDADVSALLGRVPESPVEAAWWWIHKARLDEALGRSDAAVDDLRQAVAVDPRNRQAQFRLGQALTRRGAVEEAKAHRDAAEAQRVAEAAARKEIAGIRADGFEATPELFERLGTLCRDAGLFPEARAWLVLTLKLDPARASARSALDAIPADAPGTLITLRGSIRKSETTSTVAAPSRSARPADAPIRFEDAGRRSGIDYRYDCGARDDYFLGDTMGGGVLLFDFDNDGWLDVYFVNGCKTPYDPASPPQPNRLFRNRGDGTFEDVTARAKVAGRGYGMGGTVGDYDRDGDLDLFLTGLDRTVLYRNDGDGTFSDVTNAAGAASSHWTTAAGFADLDGDGDLDLFVVTYVEADQRPGQVPECLDHAGKPIHCSPGKFPAQLDHLFRNNGDGTFSDVGPEAGIDIPQGRGLGLAIADWDEDGPLDVFVANDASPDFLFHNRGGLKFDNVAESAGVAYNGSGKATASMGVVGADLNGDARPDLFITNFLNEPNSLFANLGGGVFHDTTLAAHLDAPSRPNTGFGVAAIDADLDGTTDLFVANGQVDDQSWVNSPMAQRPQMFRGQAGGTFALLDGPTAPAEYFQRPVVGRGAATGDLDNDGRVDLVVVHRDAPAAVLRNTSKTAPWVGVRLVSTGSTNPPVGAVVTCRGKAAGPVQVRHVISGMGYLSSHDPRMVFGLGTAVTAPSLEVRWPSGRVERWDDLPANRYSELREGAGR